MSGKQLKNCAAYDRYCEYISNGTAIIGFEKMPVRRDSKSISSADIMLGEKMCRLKAMQKDAAPEKDSEPELWCRKTYKTTGALRNHYKLGHKLQVVNRGDGHDKGGRQPQATVDESKNFYKNMINTHLARTQDGEVEDADVAEFGITARGRPRASNRSQPTRATRPVTRDASVDPLAASTPAVSLSTRQRPVSTIVGSRISKRRASAAFREEQTQITTSVEQPDIEATSNDPASVKHDMVDDDDDHTFAEQLHVEGLEVELLEARLRLAKTRRDMAMRKRGKRGRERSPNSSGVFG
ncbi:hypothetical protein TI39_contig4330g00007 [Zymoseptoria brevis]|uniref:Uncharacterized protein n=1 Tax=Zymoseptoria brevis TaxID=1047168 RepID=A0A0F4GAW6_9PEZI|nr:hypothetical protein TI39_contig4330g00007 [Zymoseptoria brevis]